MLHVHGADPLGIPSQESVDERKVQVVRQDILDRFPSNGAKARHGNAASKNMAVKDVDQPRAAVPPRVMFLRSVTPVDDVELGAGHGREELPYLLGRVLQVV